MYSHVPYSVSAGNPDAHMTSPYSIKVGPGITLQAATWNWQCLTCGYLWTCDAWKPNAEVWWDPPPERDAYCSKHDWVRVITGWSVDGLNDRGGPA